MVRPTYQEIVVIEKSLFLTGSKRNRNTTLCRFFGGASGLVKEQRELDKSRQASLFSFSKEGMGEERLNNVNGLWDVGASLVVWYLALGD